ncbi:type VI secretion system secreted protein VgrG [Paracoccus isoporae]|uniref:Type VI secretion system secreted protein VgrG n=1 Tax=Paracoccus isoporae TaxID=591205 RepID=A0A1G7D792_9RHOB|nr:type VI secretion system tip protein TssI/VgrG [Paracoccus isoporae]SDE47391.1 type VI secretion system secreted protein VgrG [Paracoccus isoporae]
MPNERFAILQTPLPSEEMLSNIPMEEFRGLAFLAMQGHDEISQCFEFDVSAISGTPDIAAHDLLGEEVALHVSADPQDPASIRCFHGIVDEFRFAGTDGQGHWRYHLTLRPRMWLLGKSSDNRIFQEMTVVDIVSEILEQHGCTAYEWQLDRDPPKREYCVQYGESDLNFVQRLLEHEGIFYFFRFDPSGHRIIFCDGFGALQSAENCSTLHFREGWSGHAAGIGAITDFSRADCIVPGSHSLTDYDFEKPSADLMSRSENPLPHSNSEGARYGYPGQYTEFQRGDDLAMIRNQQDQARMQVITALSTASAPASGNVFALTDFPREVENESYVIERVAYDIRGRRHRSEAQGASMGDPAARFATMPEKQSREADRAGFSALYTLIPERVSYRPAFRARRPVMKGPQTAVVVGPQGEEIYTDKYSRVKVQFHWDRDGRRDQNTTCFIRVSSAWAGSGWGFIQIPRIGQEVIVDFLEGDPDQPIITGRVYNAEQMPPYALPANATQSGWKSNSSPGGGGWNELRFEDKKGSEEVYFQAEKDHNELVKNNESRHIGNDWAEEVVRDATQWVGHDRTEAVDNNKSTTVGVDRTVKIGSNDDETVGKNRTLRVGVDESISVGNNSTEVIGMNHSQSVGATQTVTVKLTRTDTVGAAETRLVGAAQVNTIGAERAVTVGDAQQHVIAKDDGWVIGDNQSIRIGKDQLSEIGKNLTQTIGENRTISVAKSASESIGDDMALNVGKTIVVEAGDSLVLKCGKASIAMKKDGTINIDGKDITTKGSGKINVKASSDITMKGSKIKQN